MFITTVFILAKNKNKGKKTSKLETTQMSKSRKTDNSGVLIRSVILLAKRETNH